MADDQGKIGKEQVSGRLDKAKGRLQQSLPDIQQLVRASGALDVARKIIDPAQSIFRQFADDIQLKDLLAKAEALVASVSKDAPPAPAVRGQAPPGESAKEAA